MSVTVKVIEAQLALPKFDGKTLAELDAMQWPIDADALDAAGKLRWVDGQAAMTFGKHRDVPLKDVPQSYLSYMLTTDAFPPDARAIIERAVYQKEFPTR